MGLQAQILDTGTFNLIFNVVLGVLGATLELRRARKLQISLAHLRYLGYFHLGPLNETGNFPQGDALGFLPSCCG